MSGNFTFRMCGWQTGIFGLPTGKSLPFVLSFSVEKLQSFLPAKAEHLHLKQGGLLLRKTQIEMMKVCPQCGSILAAVMLDGYRRLKCSNPDCDFVYWNNPTPVVAAVVEIDGKVVFTQSRGWPKDKFGIVAGFLEAGETPEEGVLREVAEELGLHGEIAGFIGHYSFAERNQLIIAFHVVASGRIKMGNELQQLRLVSPEEIRPWEKGTGPALRDWLATNAGRQERNDSCGDDV